MTIVLAIGVVLAAEVVVAGRGPRVVEFDPSDADGLHGPVGGGGGPATVEVVWSDDSTAAGVGASGPSQAPAVQVARATGRPTRLTVLARSGARVATGAEQAAGVPDGTEGYRL